ncbi:MAG: hypothetical protein P4L76_05285 [Beijerinckiaceae bacterium]|nr:hypothetical protein [Beijerinckiaceae bacterium]
MDLRQNLAAAIASRQEAAEAEMAAQAAVDHARAALARLQTKRAQLASAAQARSADVASRLIAAFRCGGAPDLADATESIAERAARIEGEESITVHEAVLTDLRAAQVAAAARLSAAETAVDEAARKVAGEELPALVAEFQASQVRTATLCRRLLSHAQEITPRWPGGIVAIPTGFHEVPLEASTERPMPIVDIGTLQNTGRMTYLPDGILGALWRAEEDAWRNYLAALKLDADAQPNFVS